MTSNSSAQRYSRSAARARGSAATDAPVRLQRQVGRLLADQSSLRVREYAPPEPPSTEVNPRKNPRLYQPPLLWTS
jgi:hypothetical protein